MPRKAKKYHFIYKTTNTLTGRYYIGMHSTDNLEDGYLGSGKRLRYSIRKYGNESHQREILEFVDTREELKAREKEIVSLDEIAKEDCMNLVIGGEGFGVDDRQKEMSLKASKFLQDKLLNDSEFKEEWRKKVAEGLKRAYAEGNITHLGYDWTGRKHSEDSKKKMSQSRKGKLTGKQNPSYGTCWITKNGVNKKIEKKELENFLKIGWTKGREMKSGFNQLVSDNSSQKYDSNDVSKWKEILDEIDCTKKGYLKEFAYKAGINYSTARHFRRKYY